MEWMSRLLLVIASSSTAVWGPTRVLVAPPLIVMLTMRRWRCTDQNGCGTFSNTTLQCVVAFFWMRRLLLTRAGCVYSCCFLLVPQVR